MKSSVYIHIPFCRTKCFYCDFLSLPVGDQPPDAGAYLRALETELALRGRQLQAAGLQVGTVYIGGGTPTALAAEDLERLLDACKRHLPLARPEWTIEANPGTIDRVKAKILVQYGVNRISLGIQDTSDDRLALLGRAHTAAQAKQAFFLCRDSFPSVSVDIITGLPGQTPETSLSALCEVISWQPDHTSVYGLKVEEGTPLAALAESGRVVLPSEEEVLAMFQQARNILTQSGFTHYEVANFARKGHFCRHNLTYWQNLPYMGLGLGAHSYWQGRRLRNVTDMEQYQDIMREGQLPVAETMVVPPRQQMEDTMMLGLRLCEGVSFEEFMMRHGCDARDVFAKEISRLEKLGLVVCDKKSIRLSLAGYPLANLVFAEFITV
ncbi:MAG: radical SAM family heme chaperone HemW [Bacillota bacterium]|nr:radical SAM family heme chaperone HemW [Bacillota bacterium]MDW7683458.1 radical SAM family heme chaperone HemW [Bacillota bacterium]